MFATAVGTHIEGLTLTERLNVTAAAVDLANEAGLPVERISVGPEFITLHPMPGTGIELAYWFGLDKYREIVGEIETTGISSGVWGGVRLQILDGLVRTAA